MKFNFSLRLIILTFFIPFISFSQSKADSLCCLQNKVDTSGFVQFMNLSPILIELNVEFFSNTLSLMENVDINLLEKYYFLQKIGKTFKFDIAKDIYKYQNSTLSPEDSIHFSKITTIDLFLHSWINNYSAKLEACLETDEGDRFVKKKNLILQFNSNYFIEKVSYDNSTYDLANKKYEKLILLESNIIKQLESKMYFMMLDDSIKAKKSKNFILMKEIVSDSKIQKMIYEDYQRELVLNTEKKFHPIQQKDPIFYVVKKFLVNNDTSIFQISKQTQEQVIIINNVMYVFKDDYLIKKVINISDNEILSIFNAYKPRPVEQVPGTFFTLQIGTYSKEKLLEELKISINVLYQEIENELFKYSFGLYKSLEDVEKAKKLLETIGYEDVILIAYKNGEQITVDEASNEILNNH